jgi:hypothetical protein
VPAGTRAGDGRLCWQRHNAVEPDADGEPDADPDAHDEPAAQHTASGPKFDPILLTQIVRCPVTGETLGVGDSFGGFRVPIRNGKFNFALNEFGHLLRWSGTVTSTGASGTESIHLASFDKEGGLQDCNAGSLSWTAKAVSPGSSAAAAPSMAYVVKFTKASDGSVHLSVTH